MYLFVFVQEFFFRFRPVGIFLNAIGRTNQDTLRFIFRSDTFRAFELIDDIYIGAHRDGLVGADRFASVTVGTIFEYY